MEDFLVNDGVNASFTIVEPALAEGVVLLLVLSVNDKVLKEAEVTRVTVPLVVWKVILVRLDCPGVHHLLQSANAHHQQGSPKASDFANAILDLELVLARPQTDCVGNHLG